MIKLEFKTNKTTLTVSEVLSLSNGSNGCPVVLESNGFIYSRDCDTGGLKELFSRQALTRDINLNSDKVYLFTNSQQIGETLRDGKCLDKYLYKPTESLNKLSQLKRWLSQYKYVGHSFNQSGEIVKRHTTLEEGNLCSREVDGDYGTKAMVEQHLGDRYFNFVGVNDKYLFFKWLNS